MDINTLIYSQCQNPQKVSIYNGITNLYEVREVPCGKCYHCKITRINEWVTRMVIQSNYSKYVYFGTLTYSSRRVTSYVYDCLAFNPSKNPTKVKYNTCVHKEDIDPDFYLDTPMVLRKDHCQKFFKRLRKNTGVKFQMAYCGEYGSKRSRPHYHYLIWCNEPITKKDILNAWRAPSVINPKRTNIIGRIDHVDIKNNPREVSKDGVEAVYKYVCKYIQKTDFNFKELTNYETHKKNYHYWFEKSLILGLQHDDYLKKLDIKSMYDYEKKFSPFFHCSKKPALGYQYLAENLSRFQEADFRLFGLHGDYIFPLYFVRKTKESLCPIKAQSETNESANSFSRVPKMATVLQNIETALDVIENYEQVTRPFEYQDTDGGRYYLQTRNRLHDLELQAKWKSNYYIDQNDYEYLFNPKYLEFINKETNVRYIFKGYHYTLVDNTTGEYLGEDTLDNVKNLLIYYYERVKPLLLSLYSKSQISANKKEALIDEYGGIDKFNEAKALCVQQFNNHINERQRKYKLTKTLE